MVVLDKQTHIYAMAPKAEIPQHFQLQLLVVVLEKHITVAQVLAVIPLLLKEELMVVVVDHMLEDLEF